MEAMDLDGLMCAGSGLYTALGIVIAKERPGARWPWWTPTDVR